MIGAGVATFRSSVREHMALPPRAVKWRTRATADSEFSMPTLFRLLIVTGVVAGIGYGAIWALANLIEPQPRPMTITVPQDRIGK